MKPTWQIHYANKVIESTAIKHFKELVEKIIKNNVIIKSRLKIVTKVLKYYKNEKISMRK